MAAPPGHGRRGEPLATYQRRRLLAAVMLVVALIAVGLALRDGRNSSAARQPESASEVLSRQRAAQPVRFTVSVSGDLLIHSQIFQRALALGGDEGYDFFPMLKRVRPFVRGADLAVCHVETPIGSGPPQGFPLFNTPPELARAIAKTGWEACDTASNHSLDQGQEGIDATLKALDRADVEHTGSYSSKSDSRKILMLGVKGVRVAYLAYTTDTNGIPLPNPWSLNVARKPNPVIADARRARRRGADAVLVNVAWGINMTPEYTTEQSKKQARFARRLAAADEITAVVGAGPHVVQPIDRVQGKFVVYSEGNLISSQGADAGLAAESQDGLIGLLEMVADGEGVRVERVRYVPTWVQHPQYNVLPVGRSLEDGTGDRSGLRQSYRRTVGIVGRGDGVAPEPSELP